MPTALESIGAVRSLLLRTAAGKKKPPSNGNANTKPTSRMAFGRGRVMATAACSGGSGAGFSSLTWRSSSCNAG